MDNPNLTRRCLLGALPLASTIVAPLTLAKTGSPTPFRIAEAHFVAVRDHFDALPNGLEFGDPAAWRSEVETLFAATDAVDKVPCANWQEFASAFEIACDGGDSIPGDELIFKLLADVRRLTQGGQA